MASYTTLVHVHVETALKVSSFVAGLLPAGGEKFEEECKTAINAQNTSQLMAKFLSQQDIIFGLENEKGFELLCVPLANWTVPSSEGGQVVSWRVHDVKIEKRTKQLSQFSRI